MIPVLLLLTLAAAPDLMAKTDLPPLAYTNALSKIPNYPPGQRWGTLAEPFDKMQLPLPAADSAKRIVTRAGFESRLWAEEPAITKPICLAFDERGRLWIAESIDYPNELQADGQGRDRIKICEDTDGDGRADRFTIFADKLSIPTGMVLANGGLILKHAHEMLFLKDTNGDDQADERTVLFTGWSMRDTHATASNLRYGFDGWIWGTVGYSGFQGAVGGQSLRFGQGVFRFRPDGRALEFIKSSNNNTWGLGLSEDNMVFGSTANNNASFYMPIPNRYYEAVRGWSARQMSTIADSQAIYPVSAHVRQVDQHGRFTAGAGSALYTARAFPKEYWNQVAFVAEPTGHLIGQFRMQRQGADFIARNEHSFLASDDEWFAPIAAEVGPDGAVWVLDWYNYIVQHNPTPAGFRTGKGAAYETSLRDKSHGRIYRIVYSGNATTAAGPMPAPLHTASPAQLAAGLTNDNQLWRMHAQRLLVERGQLDGSLETHLLQLIRDHRMDAAELNVGAIHALWTLRCLGEKNAAPSRQALAEIKDASTHPSASVRRAFAMAFPAMASEVILGSNGSKLLNDSDAQVRMAALLALTEVPSHEQAGPLILAMLQRDQNAQDPWIPHAATAAAARHHASFVRAVLASPSPSSAMAQVIRVVAGHEAQLAPIESVVSTLLALPNASPEVATALLDGLAAHWPRGVAPSIANGDEPKLNTLMASLPNEARSSLLTLADRWGRKDLFASALAAIARELRAQLADSSRTPEQRSNAAERLLAANDSVESVDAILAQVAPTSEPALASGLLAALAESHQSATAQAMIGSFSRFTPAARRTALATLLRRVDWATALLNAVQSKELQRTDLAADHWAQLKTHPDKAVAAKAQALDHAVAASSAEMEAVIQKLLPIAELKGDAVRGKEVFTQTCAVCHTFKGEGVRIGPDLTGVGARSKADILVEIIDPNRSVEANYRLWNVTTKDGEHYAGRLDSETANSIDILDTAGKKHTLQRNDLAEMNASTLSIMPTGLEQLPPSDLASILEFLTTSGQQEAKR